MNIDQQLQLYRQGKLGEISKNNLLNKLILFYERVNKFVVEHEK